MALRSMSITGCGQRVFDQFGLSCVLWKFLASKDFTDLWFLIVNLFHDYQHKHNLNIQYLCFIQINDVDVQNHSCNEVVPLIEMTRSTLEMVVIRSSHEPELTHTGSIRSSHHSSVDSLGYCWLYTVAKFVLFITYRILTSWLLFYWAKNDVLDFQDFNSTFHNFNGAQS